MFSSCKYDGYQVKKRNNRKSACIGVVYLFSDLNKSHFDYYVECQEVDNSGYVVL